MVNWIYWGAICDSGLSNDGLYTLQWSYVIENEEKTGTEKIMNVFCDYPQVSNRCPPSLIKF